MAPRNKAPEPRIEVIRVTPTLAEEWLTKNLHNRRLTNGVAEAYGQAMARGEWKLNTESIKFAPDGTLMDGQHRLWGVVLSETAIDSYVVFNFDPALQVTLDKGRRRSLADELRLRGHTDPSNLASILTSKWRWDNNEFRNYRKAPSVPQALAVLDVEPHIVEAPAYTRALRQRGFRFSSGTVGTIYHEAMTFDEDSATAFFDRLLEGTGLQPGDPIYALRRWLERHSSLDQRGTRELTPMMGALMIKAFNAYRHGEQVETLTWRPSGRTPEPYPTFR